MRRRFFVEKFAGSRAIMEGEAAHHLGRVLRAQPGQLYELSDGTSVWLARIENVQRDEVNFALLEEISAYAPKLQTTLLLAIVKFDAFEWAFEKATELGVAHIVPLAAQRSDKGLLAAAAKRADRWQKILLESSQQSRRVQLPTLHPLAKPEFAFGEFGAAVNSPDTIRVMLSESPEAQPLKIILNGKQSNAAVLAIGPEGGWTDHEFEAARTANFTQASLGKLILRTETAVAAGLATLNYALNGD